MEGTLAFGDAASEDLDTVVALAHALRTPLTTVYGAATVLARADDLPIAERRRCFGPWTRKPSA
jgi:K+-sensing histidine kinase KdpD